MDVADRHARGRFVAAGFLVIMSAFPVLETPVAG